MNLFEIKITSALIIFFITLIAGIPLFVKKFTSYFNSSAIDAFTAGVFFGIGLLHMLGEATNGFTEQGFTYQFSFLLSGGVFLILLFFEQLGTNYLRLNEKNYNIFILLSVSMLSIHSLLEGAALGLTSNFSLTLMLAVAIVSHKWAAGFSLAIQINKNISMQRLRILYFSTFAFMTPIGVILGSILINAVHKFSLIEPTFNALAAGTFLYLGTLHGLKHAVMVTKCCHLRNFNYLLIGFSFMAIVSAFV